MVSEMVLFGSQRAMADYNAAAAKQPNNGRLLYMRSRAHAKLGDLMVCETVLAPSTPGQLWHGLLKLWIHAVLMEFEDCRWPCCAVLSTED